MFSDIFNITTVVSLTRREELSSAWIVITQNVSTCLDSSSMFCLKKMWFPGLE